MGSPRAPPSPSSDESAKVAELLRRVGVLPPDLVVPGPHSQEACARRFLVARKWSVDEAEAQLRATLAWRRAHLGPMLAEAALPGRLSAVRRLVPSHPYLGLSKAGVPVSLACLCATEPAELAAKLTAADLTLDFVARAEWYAASVFAAASGAAGQVVDKEVSLVDLQGLYLAHRSVLHVFQAFNAVASSNFPERTVHILVLNAPRVFSALWALARVFVDPRTAAKVAVLSPGPAQLAALREHLDDSHIPASLGGSRPEPKAGDREGEVYGRLDAWLRERAAAEQAGRMAAPPAASATAAEPAVEAGAEAGAAAAAAAGPAAEAGAPAEVPPSS